MVKSEENKQPSSGSFTHHLQYFKLKNKLSLLTKTHTFREFFLKAVLLNSLEWKTQLLCYLSVQLEISAYNYRIYT